MSRYIVTAKCDGEDVVNKSKRLSLVLDLDDVEETDERIKRLVRRLADEEDLDKHEFRVRVWDFDDDDRLIMTWIWD